MSFELYFFVGLIVGIFFGLNISRALIQNELNEEMRRIRKLRFDLEEMVEETFKKRFEDYRKLQLTNKTFLKMLRSRY